MRRTNIVACTLLFAAATAVADDPRSVSNAPTNGLPAAVDGEVEGDPVGMADGAVYDAVVDVRVACPDIDLVFRRSYGSWSQRSGSLGVGWTHTYDWRVVTNAQSVYVYSAGERGVTDGTHVFSPPPPVGGSVVNRDGYELKRSADGLLSVVTPGKVAYSFDDGGRLERISTWNGSFVSLERDPASGALVRAGHSSGKSLYFVSDEGGRIVKVRTPDPDVWVGYSYETNSSGFTSILLSGVAVHCGSAVSERRYEYEEVLRPGSYPIYSPSARMVPRIEGNNRPPACRSVVFGKFALSRKTDPDGMETVYSYRRDSDGLDVKCVATEMTGGLFSFRFTYPGALSSGPWTHADSEVGFARVRRTYSFDALNREVQRWDGRETLRKHYDDAGNLSKIELSDDWTGRCVTSEFRYDAFHRVVESSFAHGPGRAHASSFAWDGLSGEVCRRVSPAGRVSEWTRGGQSYTMHGAGTNDHRLVSYAVCDQQWHPVSVTGPDGGEVRLSRNSHGLVTRFKADCLPSVDVGYDLLGHVSSLSMPGPDAAARTFSLANNWRGRPLSVACPDGTTETFEYDGNGTKVVRHVDRLGRVDAYKWTLGLPVHAGRVINGVTNTLFSVRHDSQLNVLAVVDPLGRRAESYSLDSEGRVASARNMEGQQMTRRYAVGNLLTSETRFDGTTVAYDYDVGANLSSSVYPDETLSFGYDADGLLVSASNAVGFVTNLYDAATGWLDASCGADGTWVEYTRSDGGAVTSIASVAGTTAYSLDAAGRRTRLTTPSTVFDFGYCGWNGRLAAVTNSSGFVVQYAHDIMDRVTNISWRTTSGATLGGFAYEYDALGRITSRSHTLGDLPQPSPMSQSSQKAYAYDDFDRLASDGDVAYTYDAAGNRMTRTEDGETITYTLGAGDRLASYGRAASTMPPHLGAYTHDAAGNVTRIERDGRPTLDLTWNSLYQLVSVSTNGVFAESYTYDALSRRVSTTTLERTTRHIYDNNWQVIADIDEQGNIIASYVWGEGIDKLLAVTVGGSTYYALTDIQGTVWGYVDSQNNVVARWQYDAWGNVLSECVAPSAAALATLRYRFQGREWSAATGLINFRMRWYDAETGKWLSKDPIGLSGGLNLYAFCEGDPVNYRDPDGNVLILAPALVFPPIAVAAAAAIIAANAPQIIEGIVHFSKGLINTATDFILKGGHTKNARPSSLEGHQKGDARRKRDQERSRRLKKGGNRSIPIPGGGEDDNDDSCGDTD